MADDRRFQSTGHWIAPDLLFEKGTSRPNRALLVRNGCVVGVADRGDIPSADRVERINGLVAPGYVDLQVNGGGGCLVNGSPTAETFLKIADTHRRFGTVAILPTVITDTSEVRDAAVSAAIEIHGAPGVAGLHIEGPHLSVARKGTHDPRHIAPFDQRSLDQIKRLRVADVPVMVTIAAEAVTPRDVAAMTEMGAVVSIGHSNARAADVAPLIQSGLRAATHLFNAMSPITSRELGVVGAVLDSELYAGIICDGIHVDDRAVAIAYRARPRRDRMVLVSDAMPTVGGPDRFELYGQTITLQDGRLVNSDGGLAGAHVTQAEGVHRLANIVGLGRDAALAMAITHPAAAMRLEGLSDVADRSVSDLICLSDDGTFRGILSDRIAAS